MLKPDMEKQPIPERTVDPKTKPSWFGKHFVHPANISWQYCKGKKRYVTIALLAGGYIAEMTGNLPLAGLLKLLGGAGIGIVAAEKVSENLNKKTSGTKINWAEVVTLLIELLRSLFDKRKQTSEGKEK